MLTEAFTLSYCMTQGALLLPSLGNNGLHMSAGTPPGPDTFAGEKERERAEQVNGNSATYTSSLSTGGTSTTDGVGFKRRPLRKPQSFTVATRSICFKGRDSGKRASIDQLKGTNHLRLKRLGLGATRLTPSRRRLAAHCKSTSPN